MTRDEAQTFIERRRLAWEAHDVEELARGHAENGEVTSPMVGTVKGREAIAASYRSIFKALSDQHFVFEPFIMENDRVALPFTATVTHTGDFMGVPGTGRRAQFHGVLLYDLANGLIAREQRLYDFTSLLIQIGVLKAKPAN